MDHPERHIFRAGTEGTSLSFSLTCVAQNIKRKFFKIILSAANTPTDRGHLPECKTRSLAKDCAFDFQEGSGSGFVHDLTLGLDHVFGHLRADRGFVGKGTQIF